MRDANDTFDKMEVAALFGRTAPTYDTVVPFFTSFGVRLVATAELAPGDRVLDAGCGRGATLLPASVAVGSTGRVVGIDLAEEMVALLGAELEAAGVDNATVRLGNVEELDLEHATFDVVLSQMVLHLVPDPRRAASELFRVLAPGGRCVASVPAASPGSELIGQLFGRFAARVRRPPAAPYRPEFDLPAVLRGAGFEIVREEQVELTFVFADPQAWWDWGWSNGLRDFYEILAPDDLEELRAEAFNELEAMRAAEGIPIRHGTHVVVGARPPAPA